MKRIQVLFILKNEGSSIGATLKRGTWETDTVLQT